MNKDEGQFLITFPSGNNLLELGAEVARSVMHKFRSGRRADALEELAAVIGAGLINVPVSLWVKPRHGFYSEQRLEAMLSGFELSRCQIAEDRIYEEFIVHGTKKLQEYSRAVSTYLLPDGQRQEQIEPLPQLPSPVL